LLDGFPEIISVLHHSLYQDDIPVSSTITEQEYTRFSAFLEKICGITLGANKQYLVTSRLQGLMDELGIANLAELSERLERQGDMRLRGRVIDAMTTNETLWFRDSHPFNIMTTDIFPALSKQRERPLRIWSSACSSGQEPYSLSIIAQEYMQSHPGSLSKGVEIVATDISSRILQEARAGIYDVAALKRGMSDDRLNRFFIPKGDKWQIRPNFAERIRFSELNLMQSYISLGKFDVIFCRNVLIYFSSELKQDILARMARALNPGGFLILGSSESLTAHNSNFDMIRSGGAVYYRLK
jgi:chemotaxis protein methyltransferase CheR